MSKLFDFELSFHPKLIAVVIRFVKITKNQKSHSKFKFLLRPSPSTSTSVSVHTKLSPSVLKDLITKVYHKLPHPIMTTNCFIRDFLLHNFKLSLGERPRNFIILLFYLTKAAK